MVDITITIASFIFFAVMLYGVIQNRKQFYKIKAFKEYRNDKNLLNKYYSNRPKYFFTNDFIKDYMPISIIWKLLDKTEFTNLDERVKPFYLQKYKYEKLFYFGFCGNILIAIIMMILSKDKIEIPW